MLSGQCLNENCYKFGSPIYPKVTWRCEGRLITVIKPLTSFLYDQDASKNIIEYNDIEIDGIPEDITVTTLTEKLKEHGITIESGEEFIILGETGDLTDDEDMELHVMYNYSFFVIAKIDDKEDFKVISPLIIQHTDSDTNYTEITYSISIDNRVVQIPKEIQTIGDLKEYFMKTILKNEEEDFDEEYKIFSANFISSDFNQTLKYLEFSQIFICHGFLPRCEERNQLKLIAACTYNIDNIVCCCFSQSPISECAVRFNCGHSAALSSLLEYVGETENLKKILVLNSDGKYVIECKCRNGDASIETLRCDRALHRRVLDFIIKWNDEYVYCGLESHGDNERFYYIEGSKIDVNENNFKCPTCNVFVCKKHGTEWKERLCPCINPVYDIEKMIINTLTSMKSIECPSCKTSHDSIDNTRILCKECKTNFCGYCNSIDPCNCFKSISKSKKFEGFVGKYIVRKFLTCKQLFHLRKLRDKLLKDDEIPENSWKYCLEKLVETESCCSIVVDIDNEEFDPDK